VACHEKFHHPFFLHFFPLNTDKTRDILYSARGFKAISIALGSASVLALPYSEAVFYLRSREHIVFFLHSQIPKQGVSPAPRLLGCMPKRVPRKD